MNEPNSMFKRAWITAGHSELWNCQKTYCEIPWGDLPKIEGVTDDLKWLDQVPSELRDAVEETSTLNSSDNDIGNLEDIVAQAQKLNLKLPESFLRFMRDADLQEKVPTCTACYLGLSEEIIPVVGSVDHFLLRFMNDSQNCVMWYLHFRRGEHVGVVASNYFIEPEIFELMEYEAIKREDVFRDALLCADTFTEFLYRFWIESSIWYSLHEGFQPSPLQEDYLKQITRKLK